jgi:competence protein ComGC
MVDAKFKAHNANVELLTRAVEMYNAQESAEFNAGMSELKAKGYIKQIPELSIKDLGAGNRVEDAIDDKEYTFNTESKNIDPGPYKLNRGNKWEKVNSGQ